MRRQTYGKIEGDLSSFVGDIGEEAGFLVRLDLISEGGCGYRGGEEGQDGGPKR